MVFSGNAKRRRRRLMRHPLAALYIIPIIGHYEYEKPRIGAVHLGRVPQAAKPDCSRPIVSGRHQ